MERVNEIEPRFEPIHFYILIVRDTFIALYCHYEENFSKATDNEMKVWVIPPKIRESTG